MKVVAIEPAFRNGQYVRVGDELDVPNSTRGRWFALPGTREANLALAKVEPAEPWRAVRDDEPVPAINVLHYDPYELP